MYAVGRGGCKRVEWPFLCSKKKVTVRKVLVCALCFIVWGPTDKFLPTGTAQCERSIPFLFCFIVKNKKKKKRIYVKLCVCVCFCVRAYLFYILSSVVQLSLPPS